jgi:hypothetical protein
VVESGEDRACLSARREDIPGRLYSFVNQDFRSSSGSLTKLAPILLASPRVRSFAQALLKRVLLKRVLGPALLKRVLGRVWLRPMHRLCSAAT